MNPHTPVFSRALLWCLALLTIAPFLMALVTSFKTQAELFQGVFSLPGAFRLTNYLSAWQDGHFRIYFVNSVLVVILSIFVGILSGFAFAFLRVPGKTLFALLIVLTNGVL